MQKDKKSLLKKAMVGLLSILLLSGACASFYCIGKVIGIAEAQKALNGNSNNEGSKEEKIVSKVLTLAPKGD